MDLLSGDQKGPCPPSVPSMGCDSRSRKLRIQSFPSFSYATTLPSGEKLGSDRSGPETRAAVTAPGADDALLCSKKSQEMNPASSARRAHGSMESHRAGDRVGASCEEVLSVVPERNSSIVIRASPMDCRRCL